MALSDSMFLFEIAIEELKTYFTYKDYKVLVQFADVFQVYLNNTKLEPIQKKRPKKKQKIRVDNAKGTKASVDSKITVGRSVLVVSNDEILKDKMRKYPLELTFRSKYDTDIILAYTKIAWHESFLEYVNELSNLNNTDSISFSGNHNVFHEYTSKRMATVKLSIKLSRLKDKWTTRFKALSEGNQQSFMNSGSNSNQNHITEEKEKDLTLEIGTIRTLNHSDKSKIRRMSDVPFKTTVSGELRTNSEANDKTVISNNEPQNKAKNNKTVLLVKSETNVAIRKKQILAKSHSYCTLENYEYLNTLTYVFGDNRGPFGNQVYCVGYFTVHNDLKKESITPKESVKSSKSSEKNDYTTEKYQFSLCDDECPNKNPSAFGCLSHCSLDLSKDDKHLIRVIECDRTHCSGAKDRELPSPPDERLMVDLSSIRKDNRVPEKFEQVVGALTAKIQMGPHPCYCSCECTFGFTKKTTYCNICGGVEKFGEEKLGPLSFPCPIYHKLVDKYKIKTVSSGSDSKRKSPKQPSVDKNNESEKDSKKGKQKKKEDRFKFNYGYTAPHIGHSQCAMPCTGTLGAVPKYMGWLWTAEDVPGMRFRPLWKPGAANKHVVRLLKIARNPDEAISKKRKREKTKKKLLKRPLLVVHKKEGEFTVTMETMKPYTKPRAINQQPYEEKPLITYTIGRSDEENRARRKKKERAQRRLERAQREFIQSAFKDMCQEICLKTYQQALGILPNTEDPDCTCYPAEPRPDRTNMDRSCSCSEDSASLGSATDSDEWVVEFTPPNAYFDPSFKGKKVFKVDKETQYTYLDYRVKLLDRYGNPVPRLFKGPDGKQQCSDLGGFWSPQHEWLQINVDGYIAPDNRWAPMAFIGPNGEQVDAEDGKFQIANGKWLVVGVDGFIDSRGKWRYYSTPRGSPFQKKFEPSKRSNKKGDTKQAVVVAPSNTTWSCFGDASPKQLSKMGIIGHGFDRKLLTATLKTMIARGEDVKIPQPSAVWRRPNKPKKNLV